MRVMTNPSNGRGGWKSRCTYVRRAARACIFKNRFFLFITPTRTYVRCVSELMFGHGIIFFPIYCFMIKVFFDYIGFIVVFKRIHFFKFHSISVSEI